MSGLARRLAPALLLLAAAAAAPAQGTKADYARAAGLRAQSADRVLGILGRPQWLDGGRVGYQARRAGGRVELVLVDPAAPAEERRRVLGDEDALRARLGLGDGPARVARLAWRGADELLLLMAGDGAAFSWRLGADEVAPLDPAEVGEFRLAPGRGPRGGGGDTGILFVNRTAGPVELRWVSGGGEGRSYGTVPAGGRRWQHTFVGHAWRVTAADGHELARFTGAPAAGVAVVEESAPPQQPRQRGERADRPAAHPEAFVRDHDLWLRDASGAETPLTSDGSAEDAYGGPFLWSPDGRVLACLQTVPAEPHPVTIVDSRPDDQLQPRTIEFDYLKPGDRIARPRLRLFRIGQDGSAVPLPVDDALAPNPWSLGRYSWAPDSSEFFYLYNQRGHQVLRWLAVDTRSGATRAVVEEVSPTFVDYAGKTFLHVLEGGAQALWMSERSGWNHLYLVDVASGEVERAVTAGEWVVRAVDHVDEARREVRLRLMGRDPAQDPYHVHHAVVGLDDGSLRMLTEGDGTHELEFSPDGAHYLDTWSRVDQPPVTELRRTADGSLVAELERADAAPLLATGWKLPQRFRAKGRDGVTDIWGLVHRPTNYDPAGSYPVIEAIYAGPHGHHVPKAWSAHRKPQELAELGFVVVQIDGMGTNWRSKAFHDVAWQDLGDAGFPDRIAWIRALAATDPALDLSRVGIYGGSAGGQNALRALIAHGDFYRAAVADCGCHDNRMDKIWWNELWMGWPVGPHYAESSNVDQAHRMQGDLLLVVGELDRNVDPASTMQVVDALIRADKDFELLVMPGAGHGAAEGPYGTRRRRDFFVRKLLGVEPRAE